VDLQTDIMNCGQCGHSCDNPFTAWQMSMPCSGGRCFTGVKNHDESLSSSALTTAIDGANFYWIAASNVRTKALYWEGSRKLEDAGAESGGTLASLDGTEQWNVFHIAADHSNVYVSDRERGGVEAVAISDGARTTIASEQARPGALAVMNAEVYWIDEGSSSATGDGTVMKASIAGGKVTTLATGISGSARIAVDAENVYFTDQQAGLVVKVPVAGGAATTLASAQGSPAGLIVHQTNLYFTAMADGTINRVPIAGGPVVTLVSARSKPTEIATDGQSVFWVEGDPVGQSSGPIFDSYSEWDVLPSSSDLPRTMKVPLAGGAPTTLAFLKGNSLLVDSTSVYVDKTRITPK
jgi:hypothetical protein